MWWEMEVATELGRVAINRSSDKPGCGENASEALTLSLRLHLTRNLVQEPVGSARWQSAPLLMFKRPLLHVKTSAPLRSSDVRKTREELLAFETLPLTPALAKQLAPDGLLVCKASTHLDEPLTIYWAGGNPLWFRQGRKEDGALIPTSYVFDLVPGLLPVLVTAPQVVSNLISGAGEFLLLRRARPSLTIFSPFSSVCCWSI